MGRIAKRATKWRLNLHPIGEEYSRFSELNGLHDWQTAMPASFVLYPVRKLNNCKILYFNFELAKEMGLIAPGHATEMTKTLEQAILNTFAIRIINEYDQKQNIRYLPHLMKTHPHMATRYLQLQHSDKSGRTSGDGRSIWNGQIENRGQLWDVSSRGTGVTCLAPGVVKAQKPLQSGSTQFGYGCGLADLDELLGAAILAEIFHRNHVQTERVLTVIDLGDGNGIGVRAGQNLMRPAHIFMHVKQANYEAARRSVDYFIDRQYRNQKINFHSQTADRDRLLLNEIATTFARFAAQLDRDYIFAWLDWDGDNVLASGGIIDYGSIRQFGLRHDEYRYDDVERFSTSLSEQKAKARLIVQTFAQTVDFLAHHKKRPIVDFQNHWSVTLFDREWDLHLKTLFLHQIGFEPKHATLLIKQHPRLVHSLYESFGKLESTKTGRKLAKVPDGVNRPAIFNMRSVLVDLAEYMHSEATMTEGLPTEAFFALALADSARGRDRKMNRAVESQIENFQKFYIECLQATTRNSSDSDIKSFTQNLAKNCRERNRANRMTGDALLYVVDEILTRLKKQKIKTTDVQRCIDQLIDDQSPKRKKRVTLSPKNDPHQQLYQLLLSLVDGHKESI